MPMIELLVLKNDFRMHRRRYTSELQVHATPTNDFLPLDKPMEVSSACGTTF